MVRLNFSIELNYEILSSPSDFIFNIHAARNTQQKVIWEQVEFSQPVIPAMSAESVAGVRFMQLKAEPGPLNVNYTATVEIDHYREKPEKLTEHRASELPLSVLPYIFPSRYCQSDQFLDIATREFGQLPPGFARVRAIRDWVQRNTTFKIGSSTISTSAMDTLRDCAGVCRDFAHLMIAMCRALNMPSRFVTGIDFGADPSLGPTDFHAYVEVYLGNRWYLFEPSGISPPMGLVRIGTGRDAADASFATIFGAVRSSMPIISIEAAEDAAQGHVLPRYVDDALSSSSTE